MTLAELITACESGFAFVAIDSKRDGVEISSGGNDVPGDANLRVEPAALYATETLALEAWRAEFESSGLIRECQSLIWIEKPYVETYRITLGDAQGTYRVVRDRYVVRGRVAFEVVVTENDGVALMSALHPVGEAVAEDRELNPDSIETFEVDEDELKKRIAASKPLKIKPKRKKKAA